MDKDNKYYGIIENLVKQHKKYPEYAAIVDEIIDDVYLHSEVIINTITNESVIAAYLQKVIATSMVTVPKKLGIRKYVRQTIVKPAEPEKINIAVDQVQEKTDFNLEEDSKAIKVNTEFVDKMINLAEKPKEDSQEKTSDDMISLADFHSQIHENDDIELGLSEAEEILDDESEDISIEDVYKQPENKDILETKESWDAEPEDTFVEEITEQLPNQDISEAEEILDDESEDTSIEDVYEQPDNKDIIETKESWDAEPEDTFVEEITEQLPNQDISEAEEILDDESDEIHSYEVLEQTKEDDISENDNGSDIFAEETLTEHADEQIITEMNISESDEDAIQVSQETEAASDIDMDLLNQDEPGLLYEDIKDESAADAEELVMIDNSEDILDINEDITDDSVQVDVMLPPEKAFDLTEMSEDVPEQISEFEDVISLDTLDVNETPDMYPVENLQESNYEHTETQEDILVSQDTSIVDFSEADDSLEEFSDDSDLTFSETGSDLQIENVPDSFLEEADSSETDESVYCSDIDYSVFAPTEYISSELSLDEAGFNNDIREIDKKYSKLKIIEVFNLRYKQNYDINRIAEKLNMEMSDVYMALSKISDIV